MLIAYLIAAIAKLILSFLLIPKFAGFGAAIATMVSLFFYLITMIVIYYLRILSMKKSQQKISL
jgi:O-antigen/teichoic acid export membrane protein